MVLRPGSWNGNVGSAVAEVAWALFYTKFPSKMKKLRANNLLTTLSQKVAPYLPFQINYMCRSMLNKNRLRCDTAHLTISVIFMVLSEYLWWTTNKFCYSEYSFLLRSASIVCSHNWGTEQHTVTWSWDFVPVCGWLLLQSIFRSLYIPTRAWKRATQRTRSSIGASFDPNFAAHYAVFVAFLTVRQCLMNQSMEVFSIRCSLSGKNLSRLSHKSPDGYI